jgi:acyl-ACP--UDP-N-acetylglucosamine O-acyltransferase
MSGIQRAMGKPVHATTLADYNVEGYAKHCGAKYLYCKSVTDLNFALELVVGDSKSVYVVEVEVDYATRSFFASGVRSVSTATFSGQNISLNYLDLPLIDYAHYDPWALLLRACTRNGSKVALIDYDTGEKCTYLDLFERASCLATFLTDRGLSEQCMIGFMGKNTKYAFETHYAVAAVRGTVLNMNTRLMAPEHAYIIGKVLPKWIIVDEEFLDVIVAAVKIAKRHKPEASNVKFIVLGSYRETPFTVFSYETIMKNRDAVVLFNPSMPLKQDHLYQLYYTSGTTGFPKGVPLTYKCVYTHAIATIHEFSISSNDCWAHIAPIYHVVDAFALFSVTIVGGSHVMLRVFDAGAALKLFEYYKITITNVGSSMLTSIVYHPSILRTKLTSFRMLSCGGSPLPQEIIEKVNDTFRCSFFCSYGMTECCGKISMSLLEPPIAAMIPEKRAFYQASSGRPFSIIDIKVVSEKTGLSVLPNSKEVGTIFIRGPTVFEGYFNDPESTKSCFSNDGWFNTGDLAVLHEHGYITVVDRHKDMMLVGGENVYSIEVERVISSSEMILDAAVFGHTNVILGQTVKAAIQLADVPDHKISHIVSELYEKLNYSLASYKVPTEIYVLSKLPRTGTGKINKITLREIDFSTNEICIGSFKNNSYDVCMKKKEGQCYSIVPHDCHVIKWSQLNGFIVKPLDNPGVLSVYGESTMAQNIADLFSTTLMKPKPINASTNVASKVIYIVDIHECCKDTLKAFFEFVKVVSSNPRICELHVVTNNAFQIGNIEDEKTPSRWHHAAIWGLCRVFRSEHPKIRTQLLDVDSTVKASTACYAITASLDEDEIAIRHRHVYIPRLEPLHVPPKFSSVSRGGTAILTGGLGGVGMMLVKYLAERNRYNKIILCGRSSPCADKLALITDLMELHSVLIVCEVVDVIEKEQVETLINKYKDTLVAVFHLAGVLSNDFIKDMNWKGCFDRVLNAKVQGAIALDQSLRHHGIKLKEFVLFSSIFALLGFQQLAHYSAANLALDRISQERKRDGFCATTINFGTFSQAGMAHSLGSTWARYWEDQGMGFLEPEKTFCTMFTLIDDGITNAGIFPVQWDMYMAKCRGRPPPLLKRISSKHQNKVSQNFNSLAPSSDTCVKALGTMTCVEVKTNHGVNDLVTTNPSSLARIIAEAAGLIGFRQDTINIDESFATIGIDSIMIGTLRNRLQECFQLELSGTILLEYPTVFAVSQYLDTLVPSIDTCVKALGTMTCVEVKTNHGVNDLVTTNPSSLAHVIAEADNLVQQTNVFAEKRLLTVKAHAAPVTAPSMPQKSECWIHENANIGVNVNIGDAVRIGANTTIGDNVVIHPNVHIGENCCIGNGTTIEEFSIIRPSAVLGDNCKISSHCRLGSGLKCGNKNIFSHYSNTIGVVHIGNRNHFGPHVTIGGDPEDYVTRDKATGCIEIGDDNVFRDYSNIHAPEGSRGPPYDGVTKVGNKCYIMNFAHIAHDNILEDEVTIACNVQLAGFVRIMFKANLGIGTTVHQYSTIGQYAMVGMGSIVVRDVLPFTTFTSRDGIGSSEMLNFVGLQRAGVSSDKISSLEHFYSRECSSQNRTLYEQVVNSKNASSCPWYGVELQRFDKHRNFQKRKRPLAMIKF